MSVWMDLRTRKVLDFTGLVRDFEGKTVIVEGKKDRKALNSLGIRNIIALNGMPLSRVAGRVKTPEIVILTDFDREGKRLEKKLTSLLQPHNFKVNKKLRIKFMKFGKNKIEDFNFRGDNHVKISSDINQVHNKSPDKSGGSN